MDNSFLAIGAMADSAKGSISIEPPLAADDGSMNRPTRRARPFYGPDIDPDQAFILSGEGAAAMGSGTVGAPTKAGATMAKQKAKKRTIDSASMAPLPVVKPIVYEEWLQDYLNKHPAIGYIKLLKALEQAMHVTCTETAMQRWLNNHEPITVEPTIADHEDFLVEQLVKNPSIGYKLMMKAIKKARKE